MSLWKRKEVQKVLWKKLRERSWRGFQEINADGYGENDMGTKIRRGFSFWGRVQGVGFRYKMYYLAQKYNATGWVQNECNGSVTAQVQGEEVSIDTVSYTHLTLPTN